MRVRVRRNVFRRRRRVNRVRKRAERSGERNEAKDTRIFWTEFCLGFTVIP